MFENILVADSNVEHRDRFYEILNSMGYKVDCAANTNEALVRLQTDRPHLLIIDEGLNSDGGLKALEKIRGFEHNMKVVFLAKTDLDTNLETQVRRLGVSAVVKKDFSSHLMFKNILGVLREADEKVSGQKYQDLGRVLIVDDTEGMRITLTNFLRMRGFDVLDASSGDQALLEIKVKKPTLVLTDMRMPGMDGLMTLKKIKELDSGIKVVMMTAIDDEDIMSEAKKLGACDYLIKPFDLEKLEALVLSVLIQERRFNS